MGGGSTTIKALAHTSLLTSLFLFLRAPAPISARLAHMPIARGIENLFCFMSERAGIGIFVLRNRNITTTATRESWSAGVPVVCIALGIWPVERGT